MQDRCALIQLSIELATTEVRTWLCTMLVHHFAATPGSFYLCTGAVYGTYTWHCTRESNDKDIGRLVLTRKSKACY